MALEPIGRALLGTDGALAFACPAGMSPIRPALVPITTTVHRTAARLVAGGHAWAARGAA